MNPNLPVNSTLAGKDGAPLPVWYRFFSNASKLLVALTQSGTTAQQPTSFLWVGRPYFNTDLVMVEFWDGSAWVTPGGGGAGAPTNATYVTMTLNATLTNERTAAVTSPITLTDGGANNPVTWAFDQTVALGNNARVAVRKNSGAVVGVRRRLNLIEGSGVSFTIADDAGNEEIDVTVAASAFTASRVVLNLPYPACREYTVNVVDAAITGTSKVLVSLAGSADSAENDAGTIDLLGLSAFAKAGSMDVQLNFLVPHAGAIPINYAVSA